MTQVGVAEGIFHITSMICEVPSGMAADLFGRKKTYLLSMGLYGVSMVSAAMLTEPFVAKAPKMGQAGLFTGMKKRLAAHIKASAAFMESHPKTMCKLFASAAVGCPVYVTVMFLQEHLTAIGWPEIWIGVPLLTMRLFGAVGVWLESRVKGRLARNMAVCGILSGAGACLAGCSWIFLNGDISGSRNLRGLDARFTVPEEKQMTKK